jgi:hypothetical protein
MTDSWLRRSGQTWKTLWALRCGAVGMALVVGFFIATAVAKQTLPDWIVLFPLASLPLLAAHSVLPMLARCGVCDLHLESSAAARQLPRSQRREWLEGIQACPVCGDDGSATAASQAEWQAKGAGSEPAYWSSRRILLALLVTIICVGGGIAIGGHYRVR